MPKINVYLPDELAAAVRDAQLPVSAICQAALERAVRDLRSVRGSDEGPDLFQTGGFARFTERAKAALSGAQIAARQHEHDYVGTEHLLLGILDEGSNLAVRVLASLDVEPDDIRREVIGCLGPACEAPLPERPPFTTRAQKALEQSMKEALGLGHNYIGCEHFLLALLADDGMAANVLRSMGIDARAARRGVLAALGGVVHAAAPPAASHLDEILRRLDAIEQRLGDNKNNN